LLCSRAMRKGTLFTVSAPSGAGKTRLVKALVAQTPDLVLSVSHTTRPMRPGEEAGVDYHFVDPGQFDALVRQGAFLEHACVFGNRYGTARSSVDAALETGNSVILEIDWQGAAQVRQHAPEAVSLFILPPSRAELERRLRDRGQDSEDVIARRMAAACDEISHYAEADFIVVNDDFSRALADAASIIRSQGLHRAKQVMALSDLVDSLLGD